MFLSQLRAGRDPHHTAAPLPAQQQVREIFEADLDRLIGQRRRGAPITVALVGLDGVEALAARAGRRWAERQIGAAAAALGAIGACDDRVLAYHTGALTFAVVLRETTLDEAFEVATTIWRAIVRDTDSITVTIGLAGLDDDRTDDATTLEIAADAALDEARSLGQPECGLVVAAAAAGTGLRWLAARSATSSSAAL